VYDPDGVDKGYKVTFIKTGVSWVKDRVEFYTDELVRYEDIGIEKIRVGTNIMQDYAQNNLDNDVYWGEGFFNPDGSVSISGEFYYSKDYIRAYSGVYDFRVRFYGNAKILVFDESKNIILVISNETEPSSYINEYTLPSETYWIKVSWLKEGSDVVVDDKLKIITKTEHLEITEDVF